MTSRRSSASRSSASRSSSSTRAGGSRAPKVRTDGKVDVSCPQCATKYRIAADDLDAQIECQECHRVFFGKTAVGKRARTQDHSKAYIGFGIAAVAIVGIFMLMSNSGDAPVKKPKVVEAPKIVHTVGNNPRTAQLVQWGQAIGSNNPVSIPRYSDLTAIAAMLEVPADEAAVMAALQKHESTRFLRELECLSGTLLHESMMSSATGTGKLYLTPKSGSVDYHANTRAEIEVTFRAEGDNVRVTGWKVTMTPARKTPDPSKQTFIPNENIAKPAEAEITDTAGTRKVAESEPSAVPHWDQATEAQRKKADDIVATILRSADPEAPGGAFTSALLKVRSIEDRKAVVPRVLNAMYELYGDVNGNNLKLSQLDRALREFTKFGVNYTVADSGDAATDKKRRESSVRQWFAFWWRYSSGDLGDFLDLRDNLEEPLEEPAPKKRR